MWISTTACMLVVVLALQAGNLVKYWKVMSHPIETMGSVTATDVSNHARVEYAFEATGGERFSGIGNAGNGTPEFEHLTVGSSVLVTYAAGDPTASFLGRPRMWLWGEIVAGGVWAVLGSALIVGALLRRRKLGQSPPFGLSK